MRAHGRRGRTRAVACLVGTLALAPLAGCSTSHQPAAAPTATTKTTVAPTTTTTTLPPAKQATAEAAAAVSAWAAGNTLQALSVATPPSVSTLFAVPYPAGLAIQRGCSDAFQPIVCTYGPPGGASPNDPIYQIDATQTSQGWYVSGVRIEN